MYIGIVELLPHWAGPQPARRVYRPLTALFNLHDPSKPLPDATGTATDAQPSPGPVPTHADDARNPRIPGRPPCHECDGHRVGADALARDAASGVGCSAAGRGGF